MSLRNAGLVAGLLHCMLVAIAPAPARAQLNIICSVQPEWCTGAAVAFEKQTGIKVSMTKKGSGESIAQVNAEKDNPKTDLWFGGTGYEIGSMSVVKGARNVDNAKKFYDWALTADAQKIAAQTKQFQLPSNRNAPQPPESPRFADMKLIDYDQVKYGSVAERKRLIARWDKEVNATGK